jgi:DNA-binding protein
VTQKNDVHKYFKYAKYLLTGDTPKESKIVIKAMGKAVVNAVRLIELIKNIIGDMHQYYRIETTEIEDKPKDGEQTETIIKKITTFVTILSKEKVEGLKSYDEHLDDVL